MGTRLTTSVEKKFYKRQDGKYLEILVRYIVMTDDKGTIISKQEDKTDIIAVYREATGNERSMNGEAVYTEPNGKQIRLIAVRTDRAW